MRRRRRRYLLERAEQAGGGCGASGEQSRSRDWLYESYYCMSQQHPLIVFLLLIVMGACLALLAVFFASGLVRDALPVRDPGTPAARLRAPLPAPSVEPSRAGRDRAAAGPVPLLLPREVGGRLRGPGNTPPPPQTLQPDGARGCRGSGRAAGGAKTGVNERIEFNSLNSLALLPPRWQLRRVGLVGS